MAVGLFLKYQLVLLYEINIPLWLFLKYHLVLLYEINIPLWATMSFAVMGLCS
jgi:hypothetical protein